VGACKWGVGAQTKLKNDPSSQQLPLNLTPWFRRHYQEIGRPIAAFLLGLKYLENY